MDIGVHESHILPQSGPQYSRIHRITGNGGFLRLHRGTRFILPADNAESIVFVSGELGELARIELTDADFAEAVQPGFRKRLSETFRAIGFLYVTLDVQGYRMGSMNEVLKWT